MDLEISETPLAINELRAIGVVLILIRNITATEARWLTCNGVYIATGCVKLTKPNQTEPELAQLNH